MTSAATNGPFTAQITRGDAEALGLKQGDTVYVRATRVPTLPDEARDKVAARFIQLGKYHDKIGWGYGDYLADIAARVQRPKGKPLRELGRHAV